VRALGADMAILEWISRWTQGEDFATPGEAMVVLDGEDFERRLGAGLDLLERGFAPLLFISLGRSRARHQELAEKTAAARPGKIRLIYHDAPSIWHEAAEIRSCLRNMICVPLVVVAPWYQARRIRLVFNRTLKDDRIRTISCPVRPPHAARGSQKLRKVTRRAILLEPFRLLGAWLHWGLPPVPSHTITSSDDRKAA
jgi:hypothetical protein